MNVLAKNGSMAIQVGANDGQTINIDLQKIDSSTLGLSGFSVSGQSLKVSDSISQITGAAGTAPVDVTFTAVASDLSTALGKTVDASSLTLHNTQKGDGTATGQFVVQYGNDFYSASVDHTSGAVTLNKADVEYTDTDNGLTTAATQANQLIKVAADSNGDAAGYVTFQGKTTVQQLLPLWMITMQLLVLRTKLLLSFLLQLQHLNSKVHRLQIHWLCWTKLSRLLINSVLLWVRYRTV